MSSNWTADASKLMRTLDRIPDALRRRAATKAVRAGTKPILKHAQADVPVDEGTLRKSLGTKVKSYRNRDTVLGLVGPRISGKHHGFHGHLVERGHIAVDGSFVPGNPFMQRARDEAGPAAVGAVAASLRQSIEQEAKG